jgi:hypothetical protein
MRDPLKANFRDLGLLNPRRGDIVEPVVASEGDRGKHVTYEIDAPTLFWLQVVAVQVQPSALTKERRVNPAGTQMPARKKPLQGLHKRNPNSEDWSALV